MQQHYDAIQRELQAAQLEGGAGSGAYVDFLDRLMQDLRNLRTAARFELFGKQFTQADAAQLSEEGERRYGPGDRVRTPEGYLGYVVGYHARKPGHVVTNVVFQAADYKEGQLTPDE